MKRVALMVNSLCFGGIERVMADLSTALTKEGCEVFIFAMSDQEIAYEFSGKMVRIGFVYKKMGWWMGFFCWQHLLGTALAKHKYRIDCTISSIEYLNLINLLCGREEKLSMLHNYRFQDEVSGSRKDRLIEWAFGRLAARNKAIVCVSEGIRQKAERRYPGVAVKTVYNSLNRPAVEVQLRQERPRHLAAAYHQKAFVHVSRLCRQKAQGRLLEAFGMVLAKYPDASLVIVGGGPEEAALRQQAKQLKMEQAVYFEGFQDNPFRYMSDARAFVLSSDYEGFGNVLIEAMQCGTPVISTDCLAGPREIMAPGTGNGQVLGKGIELAEYGILTGLNADCLFQAMDVMLREEAVFCRYQAKSRQRAGDFDSGRATLKWMDLIEK